MTTIVKTVKTTKCFTRDCHARVEDSQDLQHCGSCSAYSMLTGMSASCCGVLVVKRSVAVICDVCAAKQSTEYTTAYGNGVAAVMPSTKDAVAALTGPIAVAAPKPVVKSNHPELLLGEMFLTNATPETFEEIGWKTKRLGLVAYGVDGCRLHESNNLFPCFAMRSEIPKRFGGDAPDDKPIEEKPVPSIQPYDGMRVIVWGRKGTVRPNIIGGKILPLPWMIVWDDRKLFCTAMAVSHEWFNGGAVTVIEPASSDYQKDRGFQHGKDCPVSQGRDLIDTLTQAQRQLIKRVGDCKCDQRRVEWVPSGKHQMEPFNGDHVVPAPFNPKKDPEIPLSDLDEDFQG